MTQIMAWLVFVQITTMMTIAHSSAQVKNPVAQCWQPFVIAICLSNTCGCHCVPCIYSTYPTVQEKVSARRSGSSAGCFLIKCWHHMAVEGKEWGSEPRSGRDGV